MNDKLFDYHPIRYNFYLDSLMDYVHSQYDKLPEPKQYFFYLGDIFSSELKEILKLKDISLAFGMDNDDWSKYQESL